ncbi:MAG: nucleotide pyrophosphohydrolase [Planctomycetes bacterium]|nr:nucleotide pyrophosphohydrolase [Planctomycetota bacterium]
MTDSPPDLTVREFQRLIDLVYGQKDRDRGMEGTFLWFHEEVGELTRAVRRGHDRENLQEEFADVFAWLVSMASILEIDMEEAVNAKYGKAFKEAGLRG